MYVRLRPPAELDHIRRDGLIYDCGLCDHADESGRDPTSCRGYGEIVIRSGKHHIYLCRRCAGDIADSLKSCVELLDAKTASEWLA